MLCQLFADVLCQWTQESAFSLNVLASQRLNDPDMDNLIGNCGSTMIVQVNNKERHFAGRCRELHQQMLRDFAHISYSGISVIRALQSKYGVSDTPIMPIVFTSGITSVSKNEPLNGFSKVFSQVHTPQVWLDHQVVMELGEIWFYWDYVDDIFPENLIEHMFNLYLLQIEKLCQSSNWQKITDAYHWPKSITVANNKKNNISDRHLLRGFLSHSEWHPDHIALICHDTQWSYQQLSQAVTQLAAYLQVIGIKPSEPVAIQIGRGFQQISSVLAVLLIGAFYIPIDIYQPVDRRNQILKQSRCPWLLIDMTHDRSSIPAQIQLINIDDCRNTTHILNPVPFSNELTAYVIFTSGSTGIPKGVDITHGSVMNTLSDVIDRFLINAEDKIIALSSYNFDLSVFDIFAALNVGAAVVIPNESKIPDPEHWISLCQKYHVTIWNSVPALMEMELQMISKERFSDMLHSLRLVFFSGDWIPLPLARQLLDLLPNTALYSLGGATEAAIWSNYFPITTVDTSWRSIPYGFSLTNQQLWVFNKQLMPCQPWCCGEIYISGDSLAKGYYQDQTRTAESFIKHPTTGDKLYKTGDLGYYHPSGYVDILGRTDFQIKLRGYRIEPGEIEAVIEQHISVSQSCIMVIEGCLVAFVAVNRTLAKAEYNAFIEQIESHVHKCLPKYMTPDRIHLLQAIPLTENNKLARKEMAAIDHKLKIKSHNDQSSNKSINANPLIAALCELWQQAIGDTFYLTHPWNYDSDFFMCGGNSLSAVKLTNLIERKIGIHCPLSIFYRYSTLQQQADWLLDKNLQTTFIEQEKIILQEGENSRTPSLLVVLFHPVGGRLFCYQDLYRQLPKDWRIIGFQSTENSHPNVEMRITSWYTQLLSDIDFDTKILLSGWSMGGVLAYEMAKHFKQQVKQNTIHVITIDSWVSSHSQESFNSNSILWKGFVNDISSGSLSNSVDISSLAKLLKGEWSENMIDYYWSQYQLNATALSHYYFNACSDISHIAFEAEGCKGFQGLTRLTSHGPVVLCPTNHFEIMQVPLIESIKQKYLYVMNERD